MMYDRLLAAKPVLSRDGDLVAAIDDEQQRELSFAMADAFDGNVLGTICVRSNPSGRPTQKGYSVSHEYLIFAGKSSGAFIGRLPATEDQMSRFSQTDDEGVFEWRNLRREGSNSDQVARPYLYYAIFIKDGVIRVPKMEWNDARQEWSLCEQPQPGEQVVYPDNEDGEHKTWRWEGPTVMKSLDRLAVRKDRSGKDYVYYKRRPHDEGVVSVSSWFDAKYSATEHGTALLKALFQKSPFSFPKSIHAVSDAIYIGGAAKRKSTTLDFFGGSGTTGHAVINLNREDNGTRKYILIEMGDHFDTVLKPRIAKVVYSPDWKDGKPTVRDKGISHCFKYLRLESYEDTLNNLRFRTDAARDQALAANASLRRDFTLNYLLDVETRGSQSLLDIEAFTDPTAYTR
jgi:adenine-specific DNA-methyltransferase